MRMTNSDAGSPVESLERLSVLLVGESHLCSSTECTCHTTASQGHAASCVSRFRPCKVHAVLVATLPEGSQVRCIFRPLLVHTLPGAVHQSGFRHLLAVGLSNDVLQVRQRFHWNRQFALMPTRFLV